MKTLRSLILVAVAAFALGFLAGCASAVGDDHRSIIQAALNRALPPTFTGPAHVEHKNPYIDVTIDAGNLRRNPEGIWEWDWLEYRRNGRFSHGVITFGKRS